MTTFLVFLLAFVAPAFTATLPSYINVCRRGDPKLSECVVKSGRKAIPNLLKGVKDLGIPSLDPYVLHEVVIGDKKDTHDSKKIGLSVTLNDVEVMGLHAFELSDASTVDLAKQHIELKGALPTAHLNAKYSIDGNVLLLPIHGKGDANLTLDTFNLKYITDFDLVPGKDGKEYIKLKNSRVDFQVQNFKIHLSNLFNGEPKLGESMNKFLNENGNQVLEEFRPVISETLNDIIFLIVDGFTERIPYDEMFPK